MKHFLRSVTLGVVLLLGVLLWKGTHAPYVNAGGAQVERVGSPTSWENVLYEHFHPFTAALLTSGQGHRLADTRPSRILSSHGSPSYRGSDRTAFLASNLLNRCHPWGSGILWRCMSAGSPRMYYVIALRHILR